MVKKKKKSTPDSANKSGLSLKNTYKKYDLDLLMLTISA